MRLMSHAHRVAKRGKLDAPQRINIRKLKASWLFTIRGLFYFGFLASPIQTAETDAEGKFAIEVPQTGAFVIAAQAKRDVGSAMEKYYWLQPVSLQGKQQRIQNLSNNKPYEHDRNACVGTHTGLIAP